MAINYINGDRLYYAFLAGANEILINKSMLNKINVFPVFDSDTGNNLSATFSHMMDSVKPSKSVGETMRAFAESSLIGARGNSGIIIAQFLNGLTCEIGNAKRLSAKAFATSVKRAVPYAYSAVSMPVEGTILTLLHDWADAINLIATGTNDFISLLINSLDRAKASLQETPEKLKLLKDADVVDAGAQGFVLFLEGIAKLIQAGDLRNLLQESRPVIDVEEPLEGIEGDIELRYCAEGLITGSNLDHGLIKQKVNYLGDSLIVAGTTEKVKIHIHTNLPQEFFFGLTEYGKVTDQKVDDMHKQYQVVHQRRAEIALITDSIADIPQDLIDLHQIHVIPINLDIEGSGFLDKISIKPEQLYSLLDRVKEYPTSSQPSYSTVHQLLTFIAEHYESVIMISVSEALSGTYNVFLKAAESIKESNKKITVINSRLNSGAQGLLVLKAARLIERGIDHAEIVRQIEISIPETKIFVSVATFKYMVRGGRVSPMKGFIAKILNFKPIVSLDEEGKGKAFANALSRKANTRKITEIVKDIQKEKKVSSYCIVHAGAPEKAAAFSSIFTEIVQKKPDYIVEISPIVALSSGIGAVAVCLMAEPVSS